MKRGNESWHVRTKENIARVRRDEENAAKEEAEKKRKIALAEQEARTELLRSKAKKRLHDDDSHSGVAVVEHKKQRHIDFFSGSETGTSDGPNADREKEKREEQEKLEKNIGLLKYLHEPEEKPWYLKTRTKEEVKLNRKKLAQERSKNFLDPLSKISEYTRQAEKHKHGNKHHKHSKHKSLPAPSTLKVTTSHPSQSKSMEQLRAERLKREAEERLKTDRILGKSKREVTPPIVELNDRSRRYNSQFNPECSRQNRQKYSSR